MLKVEDTKINNKETVETEVVVALRKEDYTLNLINNYGENLLHISAANGCYNIINEILQKENRPHVIDRKNKFGWTPLMQAIHSRDLKTVKLLLQMKCNVNDSNYLGMSILSLAAAVSLEMFTAIYDADPSALANTCSDDITPLCIAAAKNDKILFFKLLDLGLEISTANEFTHIMMAQSIIPEIANISKHYSYIEDYWAETSDNIEVNVVLNNANRRKCFIEFPYVASRLIAVTDNVGRQIEGRSTLKICDQTRNHNLLSAYIKEEQQYLLSPTLAYNIDNEFPVSPNIRSLHTHKYLKPTTHSEFDSAKGSSTAGSQITPISTNGLSSRSQVMGFAGMDMQEDPNITLGFTPEFSPTKTSSDLNDEKVFGEDTPTPPHCKTPPRGIVLNSAQTGMVILLKHCGLGHHIPIFLQQEVDTDLFLTLNDSDLEEIGIKHKADRKTILMVIKDCNTTEIS